MAEFEGKMSSVEGKMSRVQKCWDISLLQNTKFFVFCGSEMSRLFRFDRNDRMLVRAFPLFSTFAHSPI